MTHHPLPLVVRKKAGFGNGSQNYIYNQPTHYTIISSELDAHSLGAITSTSYQDNPKRQKEAYLKTIHKKVRRPQTLQNSQSLTLNPFNNVMEVLAGL